MSEVAQLQKQIQQETEDQSQNRGKNRKDDLDAEEVMVDVMNPEEAETDKESTPIVEAEDVFDALQLDDALFEVIEDLDEDLIPPMFAAIQVAQQFLEPALVFRALAEGDLMSIQELKDTLFEMAEDGIFPREQALLTQFSAALARGIEGLESGDGVSDILPKEVSEIKSTVDSTLVAAEAMHSEVWEENEETILVFQNLTREEADDVQDDFSNLDEEQISDKDKEMLEDPKITAVEVKEKVVGWWEMHQEEEYEVVDEDDLDKE